MKIVFLGVAMMAIASGVTHAQQATTAPVAKIGKFSTAILLEVARPSAGSSLKREDGAEDALIFYFLIDRRDNVPGPFTLAELKDFTVTARKYSDLTEERLGRRFEANTIIEDLADFQVKVRPDLRKVIPKGTRNDAVVMFTVISGLALPVGTRAEVVIDVGWGDNTELLSFSFQIPQR